MELTNEEIKSLLHLAGAKEYTPALLPDDIERGPVGTCFDWCALSAARNQKYMYVEGFAKSHQSGGWKLHAWLTDGEHAFDPTWRAIENFSGKDIVFPGEYFGIEMNIYDVAAFMGATGYQGVIGNKWRAPKLADKALGL